MFTGMVRGGIAGGLRAGYLGALTLPWTWNTARRSRQKVTATSRFGGGR
jgi:hypothetical protein